MVGVVALLIHHKTWWAVIHVARSRWIPPSKMGDLGKGGACHGEVPFCFQGFVPTCFQVTEKAFAGKAFSQANFKGKAPRRYFFFSRFPPPIVRASRDRSP